MQVCSIIYATGHPPTLSELRERAFFVKNWWKSSKFSFKMLRFASEKSLELILEDFHRFSSIFDQKCSFSELRQSWRMPSSINNRTYLHRNRLQHSRGAFGTIRVDFSYLLLFFPYVYRILRFQSWVSIIFWNALKIAFDGTCGEHKKENHNFKDQPHNVPHGRIFEKKVKVPEKIFFLKTVEKWFCIDSEKKSSHFFKCESQPCGTLRGWALRIEYWKFSGCDTEL